VDANPEDTSPRPSMFLEAAHDGFGLPRAVWLLHFGAALGDQLAGPWMGQVWRTALRVAGSPQRDGKAEIMKATSQAASAPRAPVWRADGGVFRCEPRTPILITGR
jgi:hypothetical protein